MERKKRSKGSVWECCYANKIFGTFGDEIKAYGQKLVKFCTSQAYLALTKQEQSEPVDKEQSRITRPRRHALKHRCSEEGLCTAELCMCTRCWNGKIRNDKHAMAPSLMLL